MNISFTHHGLRRIVQRNIHPEEIKTALIYGNCKLESTNIQKYEYADLKIITTVDNCLITAYRLKNSLNFARKAPRYSGRKARIQRQQRLNAMRKAEHYQEMRLLSFS